MTDFIVKVLIELTILIILYLISRQDNRITVLEEKDEHPLYQINVPTVWSYTGEKQPEVTITSTDPSFKQKVAKEEKRVDGIKILEDLYSGKSIIPKVKKPIKKGK